MSIRSGTGTLQVHEIFIKASPQMIWEAITTPEQSSQYGSRGLVTVDSSPGGEFRERATGDMLLRGSPEVIADGQVIECRPPRKLIHTYRRLTTDGHTAEGFSRLTWEIGSSPSGCSRVVVTHDLEDAPLLMASLSSNPQHEGGWSWILSDLKTFLETGGTMATSWSDFRNAPREERRSFVPIHRDRRTAVLAGIAAMHVLAIYLIANASFGPRSRELTLLETRFIPNAKPEQPPPPTFSRCDGDTERAHLDSGSGNGNPGPGRRTSHRPQTGRGSAKRWQQRASAGSAESGRLQATAADLTSAHTRALSARIAGCERDRHFDREDLHLRKRHRRECRAGGNLRLCPAGQRGRATQQGISIRTCHARWRACPGVSSLQDQFPHRLKSAAVGRGVS